MTRKYPKFCDPTNDWAFKRIFGSEQYKDATIGFINSMLPEKQIRDVEFLNVEIPGFTVEDRKSCVDILCRGNDGSAFVIEMQVVEQEFFRQRTVLYASTLISHLAEKGDRWDYELKPTYVISVIDFELNDTVPDDCISHYVSKECKTGTILPGAPEFFFLEPKRFKKKENELKTYQEKWLFLLRNAKSLSVIPETFSGDKAFDAYFSASETANMTKDERILYDHAMITKTDIEYGKLYSFKKGKAEGKAEGLAEGEAKGRAEGEAKGRTEGRAEGMAEGKTEVARAMLKENIPFETICRITGFTPEQMELISKTL